MKRRIKRVIGDAIALIIGSFLFAASVNMFIVPGEIVIGGMTGIATLLNIFYNTPIGTVIVILNIPLLLANMKVYGIAFTARTVIGVLLTSAFTDLFVFLPKTINDPFLCAVFGGIAMGLGCGILFTSGYTTGGTDLVAYLIKSKMKSVSTGRLIFIVDLIIIAVSAIILRDYKSVLYSVTAIFISTKVIDYVLRGSLQGSVVYIFSERYTEICDIITQQIGRGVTLLDGIGWYTKDKREIIMCAIPIRELYVFRKSVLSIDPEAFMIFAEASEINGEGFKKKI